ncbi:MAG: DUF551 domain-containing protein [Terracidiphilus sp.]
MNRELLEKLKGLRERVTKGEWRISNISPVLTNNSHPTKHPHYEVASTESICWLAHVLCFSDAHAGTEYEANADLIALAPEMMDELLESAASVNEWVSVEERLPEAQGDYLTFRVVKYKHRPNYDGDKYVSISSWGNALTNGELPWRDAWVDHGFMSSEARGVTHWRKLPAPPEAAIARAQGGK